MTNHFLETRQGKNLIPRYEGQRRGYPVSANTADFDGNVAAGHFLKLNASGLAAVAKMDDVAVGLLSDDGYEVLGGAPAGGTITNAGSGVASVFALNDGGEYFTLTYDVTKTYVPGTELVLDATGLLVPSGTAGAGTKVRAVCVLAPSTVPAGGLADLTDPTAVPPLLKGTQVGARAADGFGPNPLTNATPSTLRGYMGFILA
jgi:hypothetical protein